MNTDKCTECNGHGEVLTQGCYHDFEPPTRKCYACRGTGSLEIQEEVADNWRQSLAFVYACHPLSKSDKE